MPDNKNTGKQNGFDNNKSDDKRENILEGMEEEYDTKYNSDIFEIYKALEDSASPLSETCENEPTDNIDAGIEAELAELSRARRSRRQRRDNPRKPYSVLTSVIVTVLILIVGYGAYVYINDYMPNYKNVDFYMQNPDIDKDRLYIVFGDELIRTGSAPKFIGDKLYIPADFIKSYIDSYLYSDNSAKKLVITTENRVIRMKDKELEYFVNNVPFTLNLPVVSSDGMNYLPADFVAELYNISFEYSEEYKTVTAEKLSEDRTVANALDKTKMRYEPDDKSPIEYNVEKGALVTLFGSGENGYTRARLQNGLVGYIPSKHIGSPELIDGKKTDEPFYSVPEPQKIDGKITLCWDQVTNVQANSDESRRKLHPGLDVLSPTWFTFDENALNGDIVNIADKSYVDWAHANGYQVWALVSDSFSKEISHSVLSSSETREHVIKQLLSFISLYELDGINIDFEQVRTDDADNYIQFLRELYPLMKLQGAVLSVDMYVPMSFNLYYNRTEVAKTADYIIIMGYDEHYAGSPESGPVASVGFVEQGIIDTLSEAPATKVILGIPFYVRVWREEVGENNSVTLSSRAYAMETGKEMFTSKGAEFEWLENLGCYYAEYTVDEDGKQVTYKLWLEDETSLSEKLKLSKKYKLSGTASWKRGLEAEGIWELIMLYNKGL